MFKNKSDKKANKQKLCQINSIASITDENDTLGPMQSQTSHKLGYSNSVQPHHIQNGNYTPKNSSSHSKSMNNKLKGHNDSNASSLMADIPVRLRNETLTKSKRDTARTLTKRLSLPLNFRLTPDLLSKIHGSTTHVFAKPLTRNSRRESLQEIGFGRLASYKKLNKLGEGTYATVFKGKSLLTNALVALKEIRLEHEEGAPCTAIREISLLRDLKQANIVTLHDLIHTDTTLTLVFEYLERDLKAYMDANNNTLAVENVKLLMFQLLRGLNYCHKKKILHRDLKPQNLLMGSKGELKLADFGLARAQSVPSKTFSNEVVTLWYRPPDILLGSNDYTTTIDIWGVGCIFFEMISGKPLFPGATVDEEMHFIFRILGTPTDPNQYITKLPHFHKYLSPVYRKENIRRLAPRMDSIAINFFHHCVEYDPMDRISAEKGMEHPYFKEFLNPKIYQVPIEKSLFDNEIYNVQLVKNPGETESSSKISFTRNKKSKEDKSRRQSMAI